MKKILVPTDFSANADNAIEFAIHIANMLQGEICLFHTYLVSHRADVFKDLDEIVKREAEEKLANTLRKFKPKLAEKVTMRGEITMGGAVSKTAEYAEKKGFDLIVMGTQGATGALEVFIGSVTGGVLKNTEVPILAVPSGKPLKPFKNIILAMDNQEVPPREIFAPLQQLATAYQARTTIFHLKTSEEKGVDRIIDSYLDGIEVNYFEENADSKNIYESLNTFVKSQNADLLCMIRRKRGFFESLFKGSATLKQVYNSPTPLLVLIYPD